MFFSHIIPKTVLASTLVLLLPDMLLRTGAPERCRPHRQPSHKFSVRYGTTYSAIVFPSTRVHFRKSQKMPQVSVKTFCFLNSGVSLHRFPRRYSKTSKIRLQPGYRRSATTWLTAANVRSLTSLKQNADVQLLRQPPPLFLRCFNKSYLFIYSSGHSQEPRPGGYSAGSFLIKPQHPTG